MSDKEKLKEALLKKADILRQILDYEHNNRIEFFGIVNKDRQKVHDNCCKLFRGLNPKQKIVVDNWPDVNKRIILMIGANKYGKCLTFQTLIDTPDGKVGIGDLCERGKSFRVYAWDGEKKVIAKALAPFKKPGLHKCYRIEMSDGSIIEAADQHRILMTSGNYTTVDELAKFFYGLPESNPASVRIDDNCIAGISKITPQFVYDFQVSEHYNYFAGGLIHHNSTMAGILAISLLMGYWPWDADKTPISNPPVTVRWIGQDWEVHIKTVLEPILEMWWPQSFKVKTSKNNQGVKATWNCANKSTLYLLSNKQESEVHEGKDPHYVLYDEPPRREIYIANVRGLAATTSDPVGFEGRSFITATLLKEPWMDREIVNRRNPDGTPDKAVFNVHGTIWDNLGYGLTKAGIDEFSKNLTSEEKQARLWGVPAYKSGLIYPHYSREIHLKKRFKIPLDYMIDIAIDCHPSKEQAVLFIATDPRNYKYCCDEIWIHGDGTEIGNEIIRYITRNAYNVNSVLIDHSAKGDANQKFTTFEKIDTVLNKHNLYLKTYGKDEDGGIKATRTLLMGPNNEPSLFIFDDMARTIYEIEGYMIDPKTGKTMNYDNDMMDNLYALSNQDTQYEPMNNNFEEDSYELVEPVSPVTGI